MSRKARIRDKNRPHHIMSRSIPELDLYNMDEDKDYYLSLMKKSSHIYGVTIIAYCLMDNHVHMLIHPNGGDMSKFMKNINNPYALYYNKKYERRGHLYGDRYKNIVIKDEVHLLRTSTYIHNNAKDLLWKGYRTIEDYPYSSIKDYITPKRGAGIVDPSLVFKFLNGEGATARNHYKVLLELQSQGHEEFEKELEEAFRKGEYKSDKEPVIRNIEPSKVVSVLEKLLNRTKIDLTLCKYKRADKKYKCLVAICLRVFCDMTLLDMTKIFKGYTTSGIGKMSQEGYKFLFDDTIYKQVMTNLEA